MPVAPASSMTMFRQTQQRIAKQQAQQRYNMGMAGFIKDGSFDTAGENARATQRAEADAARLGGGFAGSNGQVRRTREQLLARKAEMERAKRMRLTPSASDLAASQASYATSIPAPGVSPNDVQAGLNDQQNMFNANLTALQQQLQAQLQAAQAANSERDNYFRQLMDMQNKQQSAADNERTRMSRMQADKDLEAALLLQRGLQQQQAQAANFRYL